MEVHEDGLEALAVLHERARDTPAHRAAELRHPAEGLRRGQQLDRARVRAAAPHQGLVSEDRVIVGSDDRLEGHVEARQRLAKRLLGGGEVGQHRGGTRLRHQELVLQARHLPLVHRALDLLDEHAWHDRLGEEGGRATSEGPLRGLDRGLAGYHQRREESVALPHRREDIEAVGVRQAEVHHDELELLGLERREPRGPCVGLDDPQPPGLEHRPERVSERGVVFDQENHRAAGIGLGRGCDRARGRKFLHLALPTGRRRGVDGVDGVDGAAREGRRGEGLPEDRDARPEGLDRVVEIPRDDQQLGLRGGLPGVGEDLDPAEARQHHVADQQAQRRAERIELTARGLTIRGLDHVEAGLGEHPRPGPSQRSVVLDEKAGRPTGMSGDALGVVRPALANRDLREGQVDDKGRSLARRGAHADGAARPLDQHLRGREAESGAHAPRLRAEERVEDPLSGLAVNPRAAVGHLEPHVATPDERARSLRGAGDRDGDRPSARHGVPRVRDQVEQHLLE